MCVLGHCVMDILAGLMPLSIEDPLVDIFQAGISEKHL